MAVPEIMHKGVGVDQELADEEHIRRSPYIRTFSRGMGADGSRVSIPHGWRWVGLVIQRTIVQGPFLREEAERLKSLLKPLAEAAILARTSALRASPASATRWS